MNSSLVRPSGHIITTHPDTDRSEQLDTVQCKHCGRHWIWKKGSGNVRGWCFQCNGFFCGPSCEVCVPQEVLLDNIEQGRDLKYRPITVSSGWDR